MSQNPYRDGSRRAVIAAHYLAGKTQDETFRALRGYVGRPPLVFERNSNGRRVPLPLIGQHAALWRTIRRTWEDMRDTRNIAPRPSQQNTSIVRMSVDALNGQGSATFPAEQSPAEQSPAEQSPAEQSPAEQSPAEVEPEQVEPEPFSTETEAEYFLRELRRLRVFADERGLDTLGMRPAVYARQAIEQGIPARAMLAAMCMHWPEDARHEGRVPDCNPAEISERIAGAHELLGYVVKLARARVPVMLIGPAGAGKSYLAKQLAEHLSLPYGECPLTVGATPSWLLGRQTLQGFSSVPMIDIYSGGGVFCFEELDASDPNMLLAVNNALANGELFNPVNGESYPKHADFVPVATANTYGLGADRNFTGRERLDAATIDRWRMGRVFVPFDERLEERIIRGEVNGNA